MRERYASRSLPDYGAFLKSPTLTPECLRKSLGTLRQ
jgi:hypothetical protein